MEEIQIKKRRLSKTDYLLLGGSVSAGIAIVGICASILFDCSWVTSLFT